LNAVPGTLPPMYVDLVVGINVALLKLLIFFFRSFIASGVALILEADRECTPSQFISD
jgi:hypothetical protein